MPGVTEQETRSFVVFRLGAEEYALPIERVQSIIRYEEATPVPRAPKTVQGIINMRGVVIPVLDLSERLRGVGFTPSVTSRIIVAEASGGAVGLAVDAANEVTSFPVESIRPAPESVLTEEIMGAVEGVAEREGSLVIILDLDGAIPRTEYARVHIPDVPQEGDADV